MSVNLGEVAVMKNRIPSLVLVLVLGTIGLQAQDFRKVEQILVRLDSTLKTVHAPAAHAAQHPPDSLQGATSANLTAAVQ